MYHLVGRHFRSLEVIGGYYEAAVEEMVPARERLRQLDRSKDNNNHQKNSCSVIL